MNRKLEQLISLPLYILTLGIAAVPILTHYSMVKQNYEVKKLKKASYKEIKEMMLSVEWEFNSKYPTSLFDKNNYSANYFHASIFRFGEVGYLLTLYGYIRASMLQKKIAKSLPNYRPTEKMYVK